MIQLTPHMPIFIFHKPIDFRCGIEKLICISSAVSGLSPFGGTLFIFRNNLLTSLKMLIYDGTGFWLCQKRLSDNKFPWWPSTESLSNLDHHQVGLLLQAIDPRGLESIPWQRIEPSEYGRDQTKFSA